MSDFSSRKGLGIEPVLPNFGEPPHREVRSAPVQWARASRGRGDAPIVGTRARRSRAGVSSREVTKPWPGLKEDTGRAGGGMIGPSRFLGNTLAAAAGAAHRPGGTSFRSRRAHLAPMQKPGARERGIPADEWRPGRRRWRALEPGLGSHPKTPQALVRPPKGTSFASAGRVSYVGRATHPPLPHIRKTLGIGLGLCGLRRTPLLRAWVDR